MRHAPLQIGAQIADDAVAKIVVDPNGAEQGLTPLRRACGKIEQPTGGAADPFNRIRNTDHGIIELLHHIMGNAVSDRRGDLVLVFEIDIEGAIGDLCGTGNFIDRRGLKSISRKDADSRIHQARLGASALAEVAGFAGEEVLGGQNRTPI